MIIPEACLFTSLSSSLAGISALTNLESLSLCMNGLLRLPPGLEALQGLTRLDIRHNQLRLIPAGELGCNEGHAPP